MPDNSVQAELARHLGARISAMARVEYCPTTGYSLMILPNSYGMGRCDYYLKDRVFHRIRFQQDSLLMLSSRSGYLSTYDCRYFSYSDPGFMAAVVEDIKRRLGKRFVPRSAI